ncbi:erythroblast transformation specific domain [Blomia tropicalis]|nr:erythroblast transformation specific domain [Blomia tropicalis]
MSYEFDFVRRFQYIRMETNITLWQFLLELLINNQQYKDIITWTNNDGEFNFVYKFVSFPDRIDGGGGGGGTGIGVGGLPSGLGTTLGTAGAGKVGGPSFNMKMPSPYNTYGMNGTGVPPSPSHFTGDIKDPLINSLARHHLQMAGHFP